MHELLMVPLYKAGFGVPIWNLDVEIFIQSLYKVNQDLHA